MGTGRGPRLKQAHSPCEFAPGRPGMPGVRGLCGAGTLCRNRDGISGPRCWAADVEMALDGGVCMRRGRCKHPERRHGMLPGSQDGYRDHRPPHAAPGGRYRPKINESQLHKFTRQRPGGAMAARWQGWGAPSAVHGVQWVHRYRPCPHQRMDPPPRGANCTIRAWFVLVWNCAEMATDGDTYE